MNASTLEKDKTKEQANQFMQEFANPPALWRGKPFWSWNGKLDQEELLRQIDYIHKMGFGGAFLHSRTGLATPYMGQEWLDLIRSSSQRLGQLELEAWLYDEDRWPSGTAGGMVTQDPQFRMNYLYGQVFANWNALQSAASAPLLETENFIGLWAVKFRTANQHNQSKPNKQISPNNQTKQNNGKVLEAYRPIKVAEELQANEQLFLVTRVEMPASSFYNGYTYVDTMNPQATERYLELTHQKYFNHSGDLFGKSISGIFTDEPHRGVLFDGFNLQHAPNSQWYIPYTGGIFTTFKQRFGYDIQSRLPEVYFTYQDRLLSQPTYHFVELLQQLFLEGYAKPYLNWCREHKLPVTGHVLHEDTLTAQSVMCGSVMRYYEYMDVPGIDILGEFNRRYQVAKQLQSVMRQTGKTFGMSELYGCSGWQITFEGFKWNGDWQALLGINLRCPHLSWYSMEGESKRDYPTSILHQSGWWEQYENVETYFARFGRFMAEGTPVCKLLVLNPVESVWGRLHVGATEMLQPMDPIIQSLEEDFTRIVETLLNFGIDFDLADEEMLQRLGQITIADGQLRIQIGQASYTRILVPPMLTIRSTSIKVLEKFQSEGGAIGWIGGYPGYVDALLSDKPKLLAAVCPVLNRDLGDLYQWAEKQDLIDIQIMDSRGTLTQGIFSQIRCLPNGYSLTLINTDREQETGALTIRLKLPEPWNYRGYEWSFRTGNITAKKCHADGPWLTLTTKLSQAGERAFVFTTREIVAAKSQDTCSASFLDSLNLPQPDKFSLNEPNVAVLDRARYSLDQQGEQPPRTLSAAQDILRIDMEVRNALGWAPRHGEMVQPWYTAIKGGSSEQKSVLLWLRFDFFLEYLPMDGLELVLERPQEVGELILNGKPWTGDFASSWIDISLRRSAIPVDLLVQGENTLFVRYDYCELSGLEAVYLIGDFGVQVDGTRISLVPPPAQLNFGSIHAQGLPFYSGAVEYHWTSQDMKALFARAGFSPAEGAKALVDFSSYEGASLTVKTCSGIQHLSFAPFQAEIPVDSNFSVTVHLTRRNTFGPLHHVPKKLEFYGPVHWQSQGANWNDGYEFWDGGLLSAPKIIGLK